MKALNEQMPDRIRYRPFPKHDLSLGDEVWWQGQEHVGYWYILGFDESNMIARVVPAVELHTTDEMIPYMTAKLDDLIYVGRDAVRH